MILTVVSGAWTDRARPLTFDPLTPLLATLLTFAASPAQGADRAFVRVTASTAVQGDQVLAGDGRVIPRRRLVQRLGLMVRPGARSPWTFRTDMRLNADGGLDEPHARPEGVQARALDLRHAILDGRGLWGGRLDLRLGRQYRWDLADLLSFDGGHIRVHAPYGLSAETYAGLIVRRDASWLGSSDLDPDARVTTHRQTPTVGAALASRLPGQVRARAGWRRAWREGRTVRELATAAVVAGPVLGVRPDLLARYDLGQRRYERLTAGLVAQVPGDLGLSVDGRVGRTRPSFDADSVFAWFVSGPSDDASASLRWRSAQWTAWASAERRRFDKAGAGAQPTTDGGALGVGLPVGASARAGASLRTRSGHGGQWTSAMVHGRWSPGPWGLSWDGRVRWSRFDADQLERLDGDGWQLVAGAGWPLTRSARFHVTGEADLTPVGAPSIRAFALLDLALWY